MSNDPYDGWQGFAHPDAPAGGGGPGFFKGSHPAGTDIDPFGNLPHPDAPAARTASVAVSTGTLDAEKPPRFLEKFTDAIGDYSAEELNEGLYTVFGELSAQIHDRLYEEAGAIASTILNRHASIYQARNAFKASLQERDKASLARDSAQEAYNEMAKNPTRYQKELGAQQYEGNLASAKARYTEATKALNQAQGKTQAASDARAAAQSWVDRTKRNETKVTLADIVKAPAPDGHLQYEGYKPGKDLYAKYPSLSLSDKTRNYERWRVAKEALRELAENPGARDPYMEFRSHYNGKVALAPGRTRIGGNDFW